MKKLFVTILLILPTCAIAETVPAYPMLFHGSVTINGSAAPAGTVIRAYYDNDIAGEIALSEVGIYGYDNPMKQQLLVREGSTTIRFTVQSSTINSGNETDGASLQSHPAFVSGDVVSKNLAFTWSAPVVTPPAPPPSGGGSGGGGGGGGGGGPSILYGCMDKLATNYSSMANTDNKACLYPPGKGATDKMI